MASDNRWTDEQLDEFSESFRAGLTYRAIAKRVGRNVPSVERQVAKMRREMARDSPKLAARLYRRRPWPDDEKDLLIRLRCQGWSAERIAKRLGRTPNAVNVALCRHRKLANSDPKFQVVATVLEFCFDPGRVLRAVRDSGIVPALTEDDSDEDIARLLFRARRGW